MFWDDLAVGTTWESVATVDVPRVTLLADTDSREVRFKNETGSAIDATFFQLESARGLADTQWNSLADQGRAGFQENSPTSNRLTESSFLSALTLNDGESFSWGEVFRNRSSEDLLAKVGTSDGLLNVANVVYGPIPVDPNAGVDTDFDDDGVIGVTDIDALCSQVSAGTNSAAFDLSGDGVVNGEDVTNFLGQTGTIPGDVNLDGTVNFPDFLALSANFGQAGRTWSQGDFDCSGDVAFPDFLALSANFGRSAGANAASVPEPNATLLALFAVLGILGWRRRV